MTDVSLRPLTTHKSRRHSHNTGVLECQTILQGRFRLNGLLGKGGFGEVYAGVTVSTGEEVAVKIAPNRKRHVLAHEADVMRSIQSAVGNADPPGIPTLKFFGHDGDNTILVMSVHGPSLEKLRSEMGRLSLKTVVMLGMEMIDRIQFFHSTGFIHRDIKPGNFLMGVGKHAHEVYLIDFGLSTRHSHSGAWHRGRPTASKFVGTSWFASLRTHQGYAQSRRDDLEQLVYSLIYLHRGKLPWTELRHTDRTERARAIAAAKENLSTAQICVCCPPQFEVLLTYVQKLKFDEIPRYEMCRNIIWSILHPSSAGPKPSLTYEWLTPERECETPKCVFPALRGSETKHGTKNDEVARNDSEAKKSLRRRMPTASSTSHTAGKG